MPLTASAQDLENASREALDSDIALQLAEYDNQFESAVSDYRQDLNGHMALVYDMFSAALNNTREQIDRGKDDPSTDALWSDIAEKEAMDLVGSVPYVGDHLTKIIDAQKSFDDKTAKIQEQRAIGEYLVSQQDQGADQRAHSYLGSNSDPRLDMIREHYQQLREALKAKLVQQAETQQKSVATPQSVAAEQPTAQATRQGVSTQQTPGNDDPCVEKSGSGVAADLHLAIATLAGTTDINAAKKDILLMFTALRNVKMQTPGKAMRATMELGLLSGYYNNQGALFNMDLAEGTKRQSIVIRSKDITQSTYGRVERLIDQTGELAFRGAFEPPPVWSSEGFDIPLLITDYRIVRLDTSKSLLRVPPGTFQNPNSRVAPQEEQAWHKLVLPKHWTKAEKAAYLDKHPEYKRMADREIREIEMNDEELKAIRDHYGPLNHDVLRPSSKGTELKPRYQGLTQ